LLYSTEKGTNRMLLFAQPSGNTLHGGSYICVRGCEWHNEKIYLEAHCKD
jgi:hypothetical protein